jgi:hypothetical protein
VGVGFANGTYKTGMAIGVLNLMESCKESMIRGAFTGCATSAQYLPHPIAPAQQTRFIPARRLVQPPVPTNQYEWRAHRIPLPYQGSKRHDELGGGEPLCGTVSISQYAAQPAKDNRD